VTFRNNWGEQRVYFHDAEGRLTALPAAWTDVFSPDPFVVISAGRSAFRVNDLLEITRLIACLRQKGGRQ
jgi:Family of unknown function (DUF5372)